MADPITLAITNAILMNTGIAGSAIVGLTAVVGTVVRAVIGLAFGQLVGSFFKPKNPAYNIPDRTTTIRQSAAYRKIIYGRTRTGGTLLFAHVKDNYLHLIIEWAMHQCDDIEEIWFNDDVLTFSGTTVTGKYENYVVVNHHLGTTTQTTDATLLAALPSMWTTAHRLRGRCYSYISLQKNTTLFPSGLPNITAVIKGKLVYDPRTTTTAWSNNAALCLADWLTNSDYGLNSDYSTEIDSAALIAAANICDESVATTSGSETRYCCDGLISTDSAHKQVLNQLLAAMAGILSWSHGKWVINAGAYTTPTITLTESSFRGPLAIKTGLSRKDLANGVKGLYISEGNNWQPSDYPPVDNALYLSEDNNERFWRELDLPFTVSATAAQRIAKIALEKTRQQISLTVPCRLSVLPAIAGGTIALTYSRLGWTAKPFEIERWTFVTYEEDQTQVLGIDLDLRETASGVYDWNYGEETVVDLAPNTNIPSPFSVGAPSNLVLESGSDYLLLMSDGTVLPNIHISWDAPNDYFTIEYDVQYRKTGAMKWTTASRGLEDNQLTFGPVREGEDYEVRIRAVSGLGTKSSWAVSSAHTVVGKTEVPDDVNDFTVVRLPDGTRQFSWDDPLADLDVLVGGGYKIRYFLGSTTDWDEMTNLHTNLLNVSPWETNQLAAGTYTFAIKAVDSSGYMSANAFFVEATLGDPRLKNVIYAQYEHLDGWPGTKTSCWVYKTRLVADETSHISGLPTTISALDTYIRQIVTSVSPVIYTTLEIDLGADLSFTPLISVVVAQGVISTITAEMKTGTQADGGVVGTWVAVSSVTAARYLQIKITVSATHPEITQLVVMLDSETRMDSFDNINTATETASWFERVAAGHFKIGSKSGLLVNITSASITALQSTGSGWTWELLSKTETVNSQPAAEFKVYNNSGVLADTVIDAYIRGPRNG